MIRGELKHLSTLIRKKKKFDFLSSGERNGNSLNCKYVIASKRCTCSVVGPERSEVRDSEEKLPIYFLVEWTGMSCQRW